MTEADLLFNTFNSALRKYKEENINNPIFVVCGKYDYDSLCGALTTLFFLQHFSIEIPVDPGKPKEYLGIKLLRTTNVNYGFFFAGYEE